VTAPRRGALISGLMAHIGFEAATDLGFGIVFGVFVLAILVLAFVAIRWGVRRDRPGREAWRRRRLEADAPSTNGAVRGFPDPSAEDQGTDLK
jgi:hypothetical protein